MKASRGLIAIGVLVAAGVLVYRYVLTDAAREHLRESVDSVRDARNTVQNVVDRARGIVVDEPLEANHERLNSEWEALGY